MLMICATSVLTAGEKSSSGWEPKFYEGLEAGGEIAYPDQKSSGRADCVELKYVSGAKKFGVEKTFRSEFTGAVEWQVNAEVECANAGIAVVAMEFFDAKGKSLGIKEGAPVTPRQWAPQTWKFLSPAEAASVSVHLLSLGDKWVRFAAVSVSSKPGVAEVEFPFAARVLPLDWNKDWNGGKREFTSFADAPLPLAFSFKGDKEKLERPALVLDVPAELVLVDAFTQHPQQLGRERPTSEIPHEREGIKYRRLRFESVRAFGILKPDYAYERKLALVFEPAKGVEFKGRSFRLYWQLADAQRETAERQFEIKFVTLPKGLRSPKSFPVFSWRVADRQFSEDAVLHRSAAAYEAAGLTFMYRPGKDNRRGQEIVEQLAKRPVPWTFMKTFPDLWQKQFLNPDSAEFKALKVPSAIRSDGKACDKVCPEYFNHNPAFREYFKNYILRGIQGKNLQSGDWLAFDFEPWRSGVFCVCENCRRAFAKFAGKDKVLPANKIKGYQDLWAKFRCKQTEESEAMFCQIVRSYNPGIRLVDYDYVINYENEASRMSFFRSCAKDAALNEQWFDYHLCSYYHTLDLDAFNFIRNNTRHLKKGYVPIGAIDGAGGYLRPEEVRTPQQIRQLALAAFVHGCPALAFYDGYHYDGLQLLALMKSRDQMASVERFPWGKAEGALKAISSSDQLAFATSALDNEEVLAIFNYHQQTSIVAKVSGKLSSGRREAVSPVTGQVLLPSVDLARGFELEIPAGGVRFVLVRSK